MMKYFKLNEKIKIWKLGGFLLLFSIITAAFWSVYPILTFDSGMYISYLDYFEGSAQWTEWNPTRGFTFPLILWIAHKLVPGSTGVELVLYIFYLLFIGYSYKILELLCKEIFYKKISCVGIAIWIFMIILNPLIWSYYHFVLTEGIGALGGIIFIYYSLKFFVARLKDDKIKKFVYAGYFILSAIFTVILWFLKQSFFANIVIVAIMAEILLLIKKTEFKKGVYAIVLCTFIVFSLKISIGVWDGIIGNTSGQSSGGLFYMLDNLRYFWEEEKEENGIVNISVKDDTYAEIDSFKYQFEDSIENRINFLMMCIKKYPNRVLQGYIDNYMLLSDVYQSPWDDELNTEYGYIYGYGPVIRDFSESILNKGERKNVAGEHRNLILASIKSSYETEFFWDSVDSLLESVGAKSDLQKNYQHTNSPNIVTGIMTNEVYLALVFGWYALILVLAPVVMLIGFIRYIRSKEISQMIYHAVNTILSMYVFGFLMMHTLMGASIDRYAFPAYATMLIVSANMLMKGYEKFANRKKERVSTIQTPVFSQKSDSFIKLLIVIPAYNEGLNIKRVVSNLIENYPEYQYLVVNDGSRDDTVKICRENNFNYLDFLENLGLTSAVQAGMKYAVKNGYDAVLQYDGDGQHRAEYIEEMIRTMEAENADIVVGSRFLTEKKPFSMRMMGSRVISYIIKLTTGYKITDPTSGMRLFGKRVLEEFATDMNYGPEPDTISYLMKKKKIKVREVQVKMNERIAGESYLNVMRSIEYMILMCFSIVFIQHFRKED